MEYGMIHFRSEAASQAGEEEGEGDKGEGDGESQVYGDDDEAASEVILILQEIIYRKGIISLLYLPIGLQS